MRTMPRRSLTEARHSRPREVRRAGLLVFVVGALLSGIFAPPSTEAAGPWQAQVVDAETGEPLAGVVVLAIWERRPAGEFQFRFGEPGFHAADEVLTGADGRFIVPVRVFLRLPFSLRVEGPEFSLFKAGYGGWRFRGSRERLTGEGAVIEMRPLRSRDERIAHLDRLLDQFRADRLRREGWAQTDKPHYLSRDLGGEVPWERLRRYEAAINAERIRLRLVPVRIGTGGPPDPGSPPPKIEEPAFLQPHGIAVGPGGDVWVADSGHGRIVRLGPHLEFRGAWVIPGDGGALRPSPDGVAVDRAGAVYVSDASRRRIQKFSPEGRLLAEWGPPPGVRFFWPSALAVTGAGEVVVLDGYKVRRLRPSGEWLAPWTPPGWRSPRRALAVDAEGHVYLMGEGRRLLKLAPDGTLLASWDTGDLLLDPQGLAVDVAGHVYAAQGMEGKSRVVIHDAQGARRWLWESPEWGADALRLPAGIAVGPQGQVYVTDDLNDRVLRLIPPQAR